MAYFSAAKVQKYLQIHKFFSFYLHIQKKSSKFAADLVNYDLKNTRYAYQEIRKCQFREGQTRLCINGFGVRAQTRLCCAVMDRARGHQV